MWTTLALVAALSAAPGQADALTITNVRTTYGFFGPERTDTKYLPGDYFYLMFDVEGIKLDESGKVRYALGYEVTNDKGKVMYAREPQGELEMYLALAGSQLPVCPAVEIGIDWPAGEYAVKVTVRDRATKASQTLTHKFQVLARGFGLVRLRTSYDPADTISAPASGVPGQQLFVNFVTVGFDRDPGSKQPNVVVEMRILDEKGNPTLAKPFPGGINKDVPEEYFAVPMQFYLPLNRPGKFTVELVGTDKVSKKQSKVSFPLTVFEPKQSSSVRTK